jgi:hypothetical protein
MYKSLGYIKNLPYFIEKGKRYYLVHPNAELPSNSLLFPNEKECEILEMYYGAKKVTDVLGVAKDHPKKIYKNGLGIKIFSLPEFWYVFDFLNTDEVWIPDLQKFYKLPDQKIVKLLDFEIPKIQIRFKIPKIFPKKDYINSRGGVEKYYDFLVDDFPRRKYNSGIARNLRDKNPHLGQDKLLFSEIEILLSLGAPKEKILVIYPGGGPGTHLPLLQSLMGCMIISIDPVFKNQKLNPISPSPGIYIVPTLFEVEDFLNIYSPTQVVLFSDIRSVPQTQSSKDYQKMFDREIVKNMKMQKEWLEKLNTHRKIPIKGLFKFRLTWEDGETEYTGGPLAFQVFAKHESTELRLHADTKLSPKIYNHRKIEEQMFFFNSVYRCGDFRDLDPIFGINYDIFKASKIMRSYFNVTNPGDLPEEQNQKLVSFFFQVDDFFKNHRQPYYTPLFKTFLTLGT